MLDQGLVAYANPGSRGPATTIDIKNFRDWVEKPPTPICCARGSALRPSDLEVGPVTGTACDGHGL